MRPAVTWGCGTARAALGAVPSPPKILMVRSDSDKARPHWPQKRTASGLATPQLGQTMERSDLGERINTIIGHEINFSQGEYGEYLISPKTGPIVAGTRTLH